MALKNVFYDEKARSGVIVLPCGAGKTIVGISILNKLKRSTMIICDRDVTMNQWKREIKEWCNLSDPDSAIIYQGQTSQKNDSVLYSKLAKNEEIILLTTYKSMAALVN